MGFLKKLADTWKAMTPKQKIDIILEVVASAGCGIIGIAAGNKLSEGRNIVEKICIKTATTGLGLAAADISHKALMEGYGTPVADLVEDIKAKKEAVANE